jgi:hypothetical protein
MRLGYLAAACVLSLLTAGSAAAQGIAGQTKIFGILDAPRSGEFVSQRSQLFQGWALSCATAQQPSDVAVFFLGEPEPGGLRPYVAATLTGVWKAEPGGNFEHVSDVPGVQIAWRGERPDVSAAMSHYCNLTSDRWGYALRLVLPIPLGWNAVGIQFFDPSIGVAVNNQQVYVNVVP